MGKHDRSYRPVSVPPPRDEAVGAPSEKAAPPQAAEESTAKARDLPKGVVVKNLTSTWFVQPVTGTRIDVGEEKLLADDGWLHDQIEARHLAKVT